MSTSHCLTTRACTFAHTHTHTNTHTHTHTHTQMEYVQRGTEVKLNAGKLADHTHTHTHTHDSNGAIFKRINTKYWKTIFVSLG